MQIADRDQQFQPLRTRFADADQDAGGERHRQFAGHPHHLQPHRRRLVGRAVVHAARLAQPVAARFQHDAHARRHLAQRSDLVARHHAGIDVRQQPGLLQHQRAHLAQIGDGRIVPERRQRLARGAVAQFRLVAQGEQRLGAARRGAGASDAQHRLGRQICRSPRARPFGERAVVAHVAAQLGQRDEHFSRVGHQPPMRRVALRRRTRHQLSERLGFDVVHHALLTTSSPKRWITSSVSSIVGRCGYRIACRAPAFSRAAASASMSEESPLNNCRPSGPCCAVHTGGANHR